MPGNVHHIPHVYRGECAKDHAKKSARDADCTFITFYLALATVCVGMTDTPLTNYIRTFRRRSGLSQGDVAALLGLKNDTTVSRYEAGEFLPSLEGALTLSLLFDVLIADLFGGEVREAGAVLRERISSLIATLPDPEVSPQSRRKIAFLAEVMERLDVSV